jgi:predicted nucleic acid-binding protein
LLTTCVQELFLKQTAQLSLQHAHREKRKTIAYKDVANVVAEREQLEFLSDIIPQAIPIRKASERRKELEQKLGLSSTDAYYNYGST